jgi:Zn-dependent protease
MRQTLTLGRLFDIRVGVHITWLAVYAFMTLALARGLGMLPPPEAYALGAMCALALFASVVAHELAHALVARRFGVRTDAITLFLFGGVATLEEEPRSPKADAVIALAGPALSALLAVVALAIVFAADRFAGHGPVRDALGALGTYVVVANAVLAVFNVIPAYPMDGGRVLRAFLWRRMRDRAAATRIASRVGIGFALLLVAAGVLVVAGTHDLVYGWYAVLGAFLLRQGWSQERAAATSDRTLNADIPAAA